MTRPEISLTPRAGRGVDELMNKLMSKTVTAVLGGALTAVALVRGHASACRLPRRRPRRSELARKQLPVLLRSQPRATAVFGRQQDVVELFAVTRVGLHRRTRRVDRHRRDGRQQRHHVHLVCERQIPAERLRQCR